MSFQPCFWITFLLSAIINTNIKCSNQHLHADLNPLSLPPPLVIHQHVVYSSSEPYFNSTNFSPTSTPVPLGQVTDRDTATASFVCSLLSLWLPHPSLSIFDPRARMIFSEYISYHVSFLLNFLAYSCTLNKIQTTHHNLNLFFRFYLIQLPASFTVLQLQGFILLHLHPTSSSLGALVAAVFLTIALFLRSSHI